MAVDMKIVFAALILLSVSSSADEAEADTSSEPVIFEMTGGGTMTTRPIHLSEPWEIQWKSSGGMLISLENVQGGFVGMVASKITSDPTSGQSYSPKTGDFLLEIVGGDEWSVQIVSVARKAPPRH